MSSTSATTPARARRRALVTAVAALATVAGAAIAPGRASAETLRSTSRVVAVSATHALEAWDEWALTGDRGDLVRFQRSRDLTARWAAHELGLPVDELTAAWSVAEQPKQVALLAALSQLGVPYRRNTSEEGVGFDCSGLTTYAWGRAGVALPRNSRAQINAFPKVDETAAQAGDLVFYPGHVSMSLGLGDAVVHSRQPGSSVEMTFSSDGRSLRYADPTG
jgi:cell wall-associated NlpC family hydrolase